MNIYLKSGYLDIREILKQNLPFNFIIGNRACGKTYGALETAVEDGITFLFMRRTQAQADIINKPEFSPFKVLNVDKGWTVGTSPVTKYNSAFYEMQESDGKLTPVSGPIGYTAALSTFSNIRGFDGSDIKLLIYDEFIPEKHERPIKGEATAFFNTYETINRNRELTGQPPLQCLCLANANDLANPIFLELNLVRRCEKMRASGQEIYIDKRRGIGLFILHDNPIAKKKAQTALYKMVGDGQFSQMSLGNDFSMEERSRIESRKIAEYKPVVMIGELTIFRHKSRREYYVASCKAGGCPVFGTGDVERARFRRAYGNIWLEYLKDHIIFEEYLSEILFKKYFG